MAESLTDGNISWAGGMDTSMSPDNISEHCYSKGVNVIIPDSLGGIRSRFGWQHCRLDFKNDIEKELYHKGHVQGEGYFVSNGKFYLVVSVGGYIFRMSQYAKGKFNVDLLNYNNPNAVALGKAWIINIPNGCIVNNGFNYPFYVTATTQRRTDPSKGEIGIGMMGVYTQFRLFYVDQSGKRIIAGDFNQPIKNTEYAIYGNIGFAPPDINETITAIGKQKTTLDYVEGGNLVFSTSSDIYSVDVRGTRSSWSDLGNSLGKVTETIPGFSAVSPYSFETFNANIYFRSASHGIVDLRQSEFQFTNLDVLSHQSDEASYFFENDTEWMLDSCYTRAFNKRLMTTVGPQRTKEGYTYWNGLLSIRPAFAIKGQPTPKMYESVFTGVRPWCVTSVKQDNNKDVLFVHSYDVDGRNRLYMMDESLDYDLNHRNEWIEIEGFIESRGYHFKNPFLLKQTERRFLRLSPMERTININFFARMESNGQWAQFHEYEAKICRTVTELSGAFRPVNTKPQARKFINLPNEKSCDNNTDFIYIQYRFEFKGPIRIDYFALTASAKNPDMNVTSSDKSCIYLTYSYRPDYSYLISDRTSVKP